MQEYPASNIFHDPEENDIEGSPLGGAAQIEKMPELMDATIVRLVKDQLGQMMSAPGFTSSAEHTVRLFNRHLVTGDAARFQELEANSDEELIDWLRDEGHYDFLKQKIATNANNAFEKILHECKTGTKPKLTFEPEYFESIMREGVLPRFGVDQSRKIAAVFQEGKQAYNPGDRRFVTEIDIDAPTDIIPRNTGRGSEKEFMYQGIVVFRNVIPPEHITVTEAPPGYTLPEGVRLPMRLTEIRERIQV